MKHFEKIHLLKLLNRRFISICFQLKKKKCKDLALHNKDLICGQKDIKSLHCILLHLNDKNLSHVLSRNSNFFNRIISNTLRAVKG